MKYRRLTTEELQQLEAEFIRFLAANTVTGADWENLKAHKPQRAEELITLFSDIVLEKVLDSLQYLEFKTPADRKVFYCGQEKITLLGLRVIGTSDIDLRSSLPPEQVLAALEATGAKLEVYATEKAYSKERKQELFEMLEQGCVISDEAFFNLLKELRER